MGKKSRLTGEIIFGSSDRTMARQISGLLRDGLIRKIAPRIYSSDLQADPAEIIRRNWYRVISGLYPNALLSHRSALEFKPSASGHIYLTTSYSDKILLPGMTIHLLKGPAPLPDDPPFFETLSASQEARAYLENFQQTRTRGGESKTLPVAMLEEKLDAIIRTRGEEALNTLRDKARNISQKLEMTHEFSRLDATISSLLATGPSRNLKSAAAIARSLGEPYDQPRIQLFEDLYEALSGQVFPQYKAPESAANYRSVSFFEGYFSNYIEGTEFTVNEAKEIISTNIPMPSRSEDAHDILGTYRIVSDQAEMSRCPSTPEVFFDLLRSRHATLLSARVSKLPGEFKSVNNRAGNTEFVDWNLVTGTLKRGFEWYTLLRDPFAKAIYMMFMISEVHPFLDGNGRIARVMMNAELAGRGLCRIIIPNVFREDYIGALRKLTRQKTAVPYIRMMLRAYEFSATLIHEDLDAMEKYLDWCVAFHEPETGKLRFDPDLRRLS